MSITRTTRIRALVLAAVCSASLGIAACGGDDDDTASTTTPTTGATGASDTTDTGEVSGDIREQFDTVVRQSLEQAAAAGAPIDVDCAVDRLQDALSDEDVQALIDATQNGGQPPGDIQQELAAAGQDCVSQ